MPDFLLALRAARIPRGKGNMRHYEAAKSIAAGMAQDEAEYEAMVTQAAEYVGV